MDENVVNLLYKTVYDGKGATEAQNDVKKTKSEVKDAGSKMSTAFSGVKWAVLGRSIKRVTGYIAEVTKASADYIETLNVMQVAFDGNTESIRKFTSTFADTLNLDESTLIESASKFKMLAKSMGLANEEGEKLSELMTKITLDYASLFNYSDISKAQTTLQNAMQGYGKSLKQRSGVSVLETTVQTTLNALGVDAYVEDMNDAEKAIARVIAIEYQLMASQGDLARTIEAPANQIRVMKEQIGLLARNIGNVFLPIVAKILPYLNAILIVLNAIISCIATLVGYKEDMFDTFEESNTIDYFGGVSDAIDGVGRSAESAAKKLQGLRGFDKLNVIKTPTETGGGAGGVGGAGGGINPNLMKAFNEMADQYKSKLEGLETKATKIANKILKWLGFVKKDGKWMFEKVKPGTVLATILTIAGLAGTLLSVYKILKKIGLIKGVGTIFSGLVGGIGGITKVIEAFKILGASDGIKYLFLESKLGKGVTALTGAFKALAAAIGVSAGALAAIIAVIVAVVAAFVGIAAAIKHAYETNDEFKNKVDTMVQVVSELLTKLYNAFVETTKQIWEVIEPLWEIIKKGIELFISDLYDGIVLYASNIIDIVTGIARFLNAIINGDFEAAFDALEVMVQNIYKSWKEYFDKQKEKFKEFVKTVLEKVKEFIPKMLEKFKELLKWFEELPSKFFYFIGLAIGKIWKVITETDWKELGMKILNGIYNGLINLGIMGLKAAEWAKETFNKIKEKISNINWWEVGQQILNGIINGMKNFGNAIGNWANSFVKGIKDGLGIHSPSKLILDAKIGDFSMEAITLGMERQLPLIEKEAQNIVDTLKDELTNQRIETAVDYAMPNYNSSSIGMDAQNIKSQNAAFAKTSFNPTFVIQVGNKEIARQVITDLQDMAKDNGKPITING